MVDKGAMMKRRLNYNESVVVCCFLSIDVVLFLFCFYLKHDGLREHQRPETDAERVHGHGRLVALGYRCSRRRRSSRRGGKEQEQENEEEKNEEEEENEEEE